MAKQCTMGVLVVPENVLANPKTMARWLRRKAEKVAKGKKGESTGSVGGHMLYKVRLCGKLERILARSFSELVDKIENQFDQQLRFPDQRPERPISA